MPDSLSSLIALVPAPPGAAMARARRQRRAHRPARCARPVRKRRCAGRPCRLCRRPAEAPRRRACCSTCWNCSPLCGPASPLCPARWAWRGCWGWRSPQTPEQSAPALLAIARALLDEVAGWPRDVREAAGAAGRHSGPRRLALGAAAESDRRRDVPHGSPIAGLEAWRGLPQWEDEAPVGTPGSQPRRARRSARAAGAAGGRAAPRTGRL